jgi:hypothetical protein
MDARRLGAGLMIENLPRDYNTAAQLGDCATSISTTLATAVMCCAKCGMKVS